MIDSVTQMPGITSGRRRKLKNALPCFEENAKSRGGKGFEERRGETRADNREISRDHREQRMIIAGETFDRLPVGKAARRIAASYFPGGEP